MKAELVMIGTELLLGHTVDTNAAFLAQELAKLGIDLYYKSTVGDNWLRMLETLAQALSRSDVVITSGGLGATTDDLTREAIAAITNKPLKLNLEAVAAIEKYFHDRNRPMSDNNRKQAYLPSGSQMIPNHWGTAPGIICEVGEKCIICLPGVPGELKEMWSATVAPYLAQKGANSVIISRTLKFVGIGEADLAQLVHEEIINQTNPTIAPYAGQGEVVLRVTAKAENTAAAQAMIQPVEERLKQILAPYYYGADQDTLETVVGNMLRERGETLATAESCTGGLIAHRITNVPGSSDYFNCGFVTYSNEAKIELLGVDPVLIQQYGAVSREVAIAMAEGARRQAGTSWGLAVTGIAGPGGATKDKPVGLVHIAVASVGDTIAKVYHFHGTREQIKFSTSQTALNLLRLAMC